MTPYNRDNPNPKNERIKRDYLRYLKEAKRRSTSTVDSARKAIARYEEFTAYRDFAPFNKENAIAFKTYLLTLKSKQRNEPISKSTVLHTLNALKDFFRWLACQPGYKSRIKITEIEYFNLSDKEARAARSSKYGEWPTMEQVRKVIFSMPIDTEIQRRDRALIAFGIVTGMRDNAMATIRLKHIDLERGLVKQDPKEVKTKASKRIDTFFLPVGDDLIAIVREWIMYLRTEKLYGIDDPVFPQTRMICGPDKSFVRDGLNPKCWATTTPIRQIYRRAFESAGLQYFNPHTFRKTLVDLGQRICKTPEDYKAWSQNLGHEDVLTTFNSYGQIAPDRQGEVIRNLGVNDDHNDKLDQILRLMQEKKA
jgi:integrase